MIIYLLRKRNPPDSNPSREACDFNLIATQFLLGDIYSVFNAIEIGLVTGLTNADWRRRPYLLPGSPGCYCILELFGTMAAVGVRTVILILPAPVGLLLRPTPV